MWASGNSQPRSTAGADGAELLTGSPRGMEAFWPHQTQQNSQQNCFRDQQGSPKLFGELDVVSRTCNLSPWLPGVQRSEFQYSKGEGEEGAVGAGVKGGRESREANCMKVAAL